jgi:hypothetical protein
MLRSVLATSALRIPALASAASGRNNKNIDQIGTFAAQPEFTKCSLKPPHAKRFSARNYVAAGSEQMGATPFQGLAT